MAVYAAHLTRTLQGTPSVFQVNAQEALGATVKPALRKVVEFLAAAYPSKCGWCLQWYDEVYLLFDCCLQYYYLKHYAASFSESFYGLIRAPTNFTSEFSSGQRLPVLLERGSLAVLVFFPYLHDKIEKLVEKWREDDENGRLGKSEPERLRRAAARVYAVLHTAGSAWRLAQLARYASGAARSPTPLLAALRLTLKHAPPADPEEHTWHDFFTSLFTGQIGSAALSAPSLGGAVLRAVEYGAFGVQFLRWWEGRAAVWDAAALPTPHRHRYVFCYVCISRHVRAHAACPVTRCPVTEHALVRLYVD